MRIRLLILLLACLVAAPSAASAKEANTWDKRCTFASATATTIKAITLDYHRWTGRCVRLSGILAGRHLLDGRKAVLEPESPWDEKTKHRLLLYAQPWRDIAPLPKGRPITIEVIGKIGSCADANAAVEQMSRDSGDIVMVGGYCHTSLETYVTPDIVRVLSRAPIARLTEAEVPAERRKLVEARPISGGRDAHVAAARAFAAAIEAHDEPTYRRLRHPDVADDIAKFAGASPPDWLRENIRDAHRDFARQALPRFALTTGAREERVFVERADADDNGDSPDRYVVCWCTGPNCTGRWPVIPADADNDPVRPYFCATTGAYELGAGRGTVIEVEAARRIDGFAEPD
ncbi:hypothetical protein ABC974_16385 [Sphingomonas oligophenolica]|uniref:Uncharacterized protein n=1 Tax=Sphingomonas oligophenolica TaxID=301154 RepID=A0ABU9Y5Y0_9SPHN